MPIIHSVRRAESIRSLPHQHERTYCTRVMWPVMARNRPKDAREQGARRTQHSPALLTKAVVLAARHANVASGLRSKLENCVACVHSTWTLDTFASVGPRWHHWISASTCQSQSLRQAHSKPAGVVTCCTTLQHGALLRSVVKMSASSCRHQRYDAHSELGPAQKSARGRRAGF